MRINEYFYQKHFKVSTENICYYNIKTTEEISVYGLYNPQKEASFKRLPDSVAHATSVNVAMLYTNPAGGRIRFCTDASRMVLKVAYSSITNRSILSTLNSAGFDVYVRSHGREIHHKSIYPPVDLIDGFQKEITLEAGDGTQMKEITIYMPLYNDVSDVWIGLEQDASLMSHSQYTHEAPIVYYGSSITQGASVSRPGMAYESILSRRFDTNFINLGFASSAKAEESIVNYMSDLSFSVFVSDYDYNAPTAEYLKQTHEKMYRTIRKKHPDAPYLMLTRPIMKYDALTEDNKRRRDIVQRTYDKARQQGDKKVYFIDGFHIMADCKSGDYCADGVHPNDAGMLMIAESIGKIFRQIL